MEKKKRESIGDILWKSFFDESKIKHDKELDGCMKDDYRVEWYEIFVLNEKAKKKSDLKKEKVVEKDKKAFDIMNLFQKIPTLNVPPSSFYYAVLAMKYKVVKPLTLPLFPKKPEQPEPFKPIEVRIRARLGNNTDGIKRSLPTKFSNPLIKQVMVSKLDPENITEKLVKALKFQDKPSCDPQIEINPMLKKKRSNLLFMKGCPTFEMEDRRIRFEHYNRTLDGDEYIFGFKLRHLEFCKVEHRKIHPIVAKKKPLFYENFGCWYRDYPIRVIDPLVAEIDLFLDEKKRNSTRESQIYRNKYVFWTHHPEDARQKIKQKNLDRLKEIEEEKKRLADILKKNREEALKRMKEKEDRLKKMMKRKRKKVALIKMKQKVKIKKLEKKYKRKYPGLFSSKKSKGSIKSIIGNFYKPNVSLSQKHMKYVKKGYRYKNGNWYSPEGSFIGKRMPWTLPKVYTAKGGQLPTWIDGLLHKVDPKITPKLKTNHRGYSAKNRKILNQIYNKSRILSSKKKAPREVFLGSLMGKSAPKKKEEPIKITWPKNPAFEYSMEYNSIMTTNIFYRKDSMIIPLKKWKEILMKTRLKEAKSLPLKSRNEKIPDSEFPEYVEREGKVFKIEYINISKKNKVQKDYDNVVYELENLMEKKFKGPLTKDEDIKLNKLMSLNYENEKIEKNVKILADLYKKHDREKLTEAEKVIWRENLSKVQYVLRQDKLEGKNISFSKKEESKKQSKKGKLASKLASKLPTKSDSVEVLLIVVGKHKALLEKPIDPITFVPILWEVFPDTADSNLTPRYNDGLLTLELKVDETKFVPKVCFGVFELKTAGRVKGEMMPFEYKRFLFVRKTLEPFYIDALEKFRPIDKNEAETIHKEYLEKHHHNFLRQYKIEIDKQKKERQKLLDDAKNPKNKQRKGQSQNQNPGRILMEDFPTEIPILKIPRRQYRLKRPDVKMEDVNREDQHPLNFLKI